MAIYLFKETLPWRGFNFNIVHDFLILLATVRNKMCCFFFYSPADENYNNTFPSVLNVILQTEKNSSKFFSKQYQ